MTLEQWWISRTSDYGYGLYDFSSGTSTGQHPDVPHNPNEYHTWVSTYYNPGSGNNLVLESWTVDGSTQFTSAYSGATVVGKLSLFLCPNLATPYTPHPTPYTLTLTARLSL